MIHTGQCVVQEDNSKSQGDVGICAGGFEQVPVDSLQFHNPHKVECGGNRGGSSFLV